MMVPQRCLGSPHLVEDATHRPHIHFGPASGDFPRGIPLNPCISMLQTCQPRPYFDLARSTSGARYLHRCSGKRCPILPSSPSAHQRVTTYSVSCSSNGWMASPDGVPSQNKGKDRCLLLPTRITSKSQQFSTKLNQSKEFFPHNGYI